MVTPKPVYETLPVLYVIAGIATIISTDTYVALISGLLLAIAGLLILLMRRNYRAAQEAYTLTVPEPASAPHNG